VCAPNQAIYGARAGSAIRLAGVTVLFPDHKGSMELLADRDPEEARKLLDLGCVLRNSHRSCAEFRGTAGSNVTRHIAQSALQRKGKPGAWPGSLML
jgi:hypothetical protein